jgi:hypothetical protein
MVATNCTEKYRVDCIVTVPVMPIKVIADFNPSDLAPSSPETMARRRSPQLPLFQ